MPSLRVVARKTSRGEGGSQNKNKIRFTQLSHHRLRQLAASHPFVARAIRFGEMMRVTALARKKKFTLDSPGLL